MCEYTALSKAWPTGLELNDALVGKPVLVLMLHFRHPPQAACSRHFWWKLEHPEICCLCTQAFAKAHWLLLRILFPAAPCRVNLLHVQSQEHNVRLTYTIGRISVPDWRGCQAHRMHLAQHVLAQCWSSRSPGIRLAPAGAAHGSVLSCSHECAVHTQEEGISQSNLPQEEDPQSPAVEVICLLACISVSRSGDFANMFVMLQNSMSHLILFCALFVLWRCAETLILKPGLCGLTSEDLMSFHGVR